MSQLYRYKNVGAPVAEAMDNLCDLEKRYDATGLPKVVKNSDNKLVMEFDGSSWFTQKLQTFINSSKMTWIFSFKATSTVTSGRMIDCYTGGTQRGWRIYLTAGEIALQISSDGLNNESQKTTNAALEVGKQYTVLVTFDAGVFYVNLNGVALTTDGDFTLTSIFDNQLPMMIGNGYVSSPFTGEISDVVIFTRALSDQEVDDWFSGETFKYDQYKVSHWDMSEVDPQDIAPAGNHNDGTGVNMTDVNIVNTGMGGKGLTLNGVDEYVDVSAFGNIMEYGTVIVAFKADPATPDNSCIFSIGSEAPASNRITAIFDRSFNRIRCHGLKDDVLIFDIFTDAPDVWKDGAMHTIALSWSDTEAFIVMDGIKAADNALGDMAVSIPLDDPLYLGNWVGAPRYLMGVESLALAYDRGLTLIQINDAIEQIAKGGTK